MIETTYPASRSAHASCHTRRSNGDGRFSTSMRTRRDFIQLVRIVEIAPFHVQGDEAAGAARGAAHPQRGRLAGQRLPVHRLEPVPGVLVAGAVSPAIAGHALRPHVEGSDHLIAAMRKVSSSPRAST